MDLLIHDIRLEHSDASAVVLSHGSDKESKGRLTEECSLVRMFEKPIASFRRRIGIVLCYWDADESTDELRDKATHLIMIILRTDPYMKK